MFALVHAQIGDNTKSKILNIHNTQRSALGIAPLQWDSKLAQVAQNYAEQCIWSHNSGRNNQYKVLGGKSSVGENLALGTYGGYSVPDLVTLWLKESDYYRYSTNTCSSNQQCGHYTQMIWSGTSKIGCGAARCNKMSGSSINDATFLVCNYAQAGNVIGQRPY